MTKEARKRAVVRFLNEKDLILPVGAIHANLERHGYTFSYSTVRRHIEELEEDGYVVRLDDPKTFYAVTDEGAEWLDEADDPRA